jgi:hypothetical protein
VQAKLVNATASHQRGVLVLIMWGFSYVRVLMQLRGSRMAPEGSPAAGYITAMPRQHATLWLP